MFQNNIRKIEDGLAIETILIQTHVHVGTRMEQLTLGHHDLQYEDFNNEKERRMVGLTPYHPPVRRMVLAKV